METYDTVVEKKPERVNLILGILGGLSLAVVIIIFAMDGGSQGEPDWTLETLLKGLLGAFFLLGMMVITFAILLTGIIYNAVKKKIKALLIWLAVPVILILSVAACDAIQSRGQEIELPDIIEERESDQRVKPPADDTE